MNTAAHSLLAQKKPRLRALDAARGIALVLMIVIHGLALFLEPHQSRAVYATISALFLFTNIAPPLFVWIFGATMAYLLLEKIGDLTQLKKIRAHQWKRAFWIFLSREFLVVVVGLWEEKSAHNIIRQLLYLETGEWIEVLNCFLILLLASPWLMRLWRRSPLPARIALMAGFYAVGRALAQVDVPENMVALKNILVGYSGDTVAGTHPDTFPVFQLSVFYFGGLLWGQHLRAAKPRESLSNPLWIGTGLAFFSLIVSVLLAGLPPHGFVTAIAYDQFKYPPNLPYIFYGFAGAILASAAAYWTTEIRETQNLIVRAIETLGRNSLFVFSLQYVLLFTFGGIGLNLLKHESFMNSILLTVGAILLCVAAARAWELIKKRTRDTRA